MAPSTTYILIDYENIQPRELAFPGDGPFKVKLFLGANQSKIPVSLAAALQVLGKNAEYVQIESNGPNALDFHIAYYIGHLSAIEPSVSFQIISNDAGFDPLILHLKAKGISVQRSSCILNAVTGMEPDSDFDFEIDVLISHLDRQNGSKPRSKKTLMNLLRSLFNKEMSESEIGSIFRTLCSRGIVKLDGARVDYELPSESEDVPF